ncbi:MAG TPA: zinc-binding dehydrogenase [Bryobacteraceae bacterium]|nr:zinc-binding dehydrogenase [Bryobacteraceae bacterium]HOL71019.1 zinc-binding dehydrogenase [Bryobacteraceae bacterium]HOQ46598.1 zinc-binding dehydrogenase [Bryobacteraceae bacterium]HPQ17611.1 zinc-binding dehydrogenase [Bryobacteraceae bacterium]HPU73969.1 zinc-binding dehydrogenase [Bryobacteraceae bacterium]
MRVRAALTCGTDVKVFRRGYHARMIIPPAVFGHELAGDVVAVGEGVTKFRVGQRIVAANSAPCQECFYCRRGCENLCDDLLFNNGAYAEYIRIPARIVEKNTYEIPENVSYQDAALVEPLACVLKGIEDTGIREGYNVSVIGLGPIGLMFVRLAKSLGARVIALGRRKTQLERAAALGADELISTTQYQDPVSVVRSLTEGRGTDVAIEAVGKPQTWEMCVHMVRRGGTVNFFGGCPSDSRVSLDTSLLHYSEITCKASFHHTPAHIRRALDLIRRGVIAARDFVNREEPLSNLLEVMRHLMSHNGHLKTAIIP